MSRYIFDYKIRCRRRRIITVAIFFIYFDNFCNIRNRNEYSAKQVHSVTSTWPRLYSLTDKTKNSTKTAERILQYI